MKHPAISELALYVGGDLGGLRRWLVGRHVSRCGSCREEIRRFEAARQALEAHAMRLPSGIRWSRLAAEMTANIHVGLEAGECVGQLPAGPAHPTGGLLRWRPAIALAAVLVLVVAALLLAPGRMRHQTAATAPYVLEATPEGIGVKTRQGQLTLLHGEAGNVVYTVNTGGELRARYVDAETGYVTIQQVYAE